MAAGTGTRGRTSGRRRGLLRRRGWPPLLVSAGPRRLVLAAYLLILAAVAADLLSGPATTFSPLLAAVPVLAGTTTRRARVVVTAGVIALFLVVALALLNGRVPFVIHVVAAVSVLAVTLTSTATVALMSEREHELASVRTVARTMQQALLRPVAPRIGGLRVAVRYVAAEAESRVGGDLYEVVATPFGVRMLLGDARGKGLAAVETVADVLGVFREAARCEPDPAAVARRLDAALARRPADDAFTADFVTAVLVDVPADRRSAVIVNCGHPPPLLLRAGRVSPVAPVPHAPPLALLELVGGGYPVGRLTLERGDELLLYTDGVSEARDASGRYYPLAERLATMPREDPEALVDDLLRDVRRYAGGRIGDDTALLAIHRES